MGWKGKDQTTTVKKINKKKINVFIENDFCLSLFLFFQEELLKAIGSVVSKCR